MKPPGERLYLRQRGPLPPRRSSGRHAVATARVEAQPGDHHVGVAGVGVDGDPAALAAIAPAHEAAGVERALEEPPAAERVAHGAGAVVAAVEGRSRGRCRGRACARRRRRRAWSMIRLAAAIAFFTRAGASGGRNRDAVHDLRALGRRGRRHVGGAARRTAEGSGQGARGRRQKKRRAHEHGAQECRFEALHLFRTPTGLADGLALKELARLSMRGSPQWPKPPWFPRSAASTDSAWRAS